LPASGLLETRDGGGGDVGSGTDMGSGGDGGDPLPPSSSVAYRVNVTACNAIKLCHSVQSNWVVHHLLTPPGNGSVTLQQGGNSTIVSSGFANTADPPLDVRWEGFTAAGPGDLSFVLCAGYRPGSCQSLGPVNVAAEPLHGTGAGRWLGNGPAQCDYDVFVTVRAYDCAGLSVSVISNRLSVCCNAPRVLGAAMVSATVQGSNSSYGISSVVAYISRLSHVRIGWEELSEPCSGIRSADVALIPAFDPAGAAISWSQTASGSDTLTASQLSELREVPAAALDALSPNRRYLVRVSATGHNGLTSSDVSSSSFLFDTTPPARGTILIGRAISASRCYVPLANAALPVGWSGFEDLESGIGSIEIALGTMPTEQDLAAYRTAGRDSSGTADMELDTEPLIGSKVYVTLRATNLAGLSVDVSMHEGEGVFVLDPALSPAVCI